MSHYDVDAALLSPSCAASKSSTLKCRHLALSPSLDVLQTQPTLLLPLSAAK
jgi:hypothetical protein